MSALTTLPQSPPHTASQADRAAGWLGRHWLLLVNVFLAVYTGLPWLAPVFMHWGWAAAGHALYWLYSTQCHQLPQRSYFLFGPQPMYALNEVQAAWQNTTNPLLLRQFVGNAALGWKVAWSDRMVSMYTGLLAASLVYALLRPRLRPLPGWGLALLVLPMILDGGTHTLSDFAGIGQGFRDSNAWLAALTGNALPALFYAGDALGSFNWWMRALTGALFAIGAVWFAYPYLDLALGDSGK